MIIKPYSSSRFYNPDGTFAIGAGLARARKEGLHPSVTTISNVIHRSVLEAWKDNGLLDSAWDKLVEYDAIEISETDWKEEVKEHWMDKMSEARKLGTEVHDNIEWMLKNKRMPNPPKDDLIMLSLESIWEWMEKNYVKVDGIEEAFAHPLGFGGKVDFHGAWGKRQRPLTLDWKTSKHMQYYPDMPIQLAANATGVGKLDGDIVNVLISTSDPGEIDYRVWGDDKKRPNEYWFQRFINRFTVWRDEHNFHNVGGVE